jgi:SNF2 family DNA or RNA helicase
MVHYETIREYLEIFMSVKWARIILDEGQKIKNDETKTARAICQLKTAEKGSRWILSGWNEVVANFLLIVMLQQPRL